MKKIILAVFCTMLSSAAFSKEKNENTFYGPEKGTFAVSFSAMPIINFVGNMFNGTTRQTFEGVKGQGSYIFDGSTIDAKYYVSDRIGLTFGAGFNCTSSRVFSYKSMEEDAVSKSTEGNNEVMLTAGAQYVIRPGRRLQPVIGASLLYVFANNVNKHKDFENKDNDRMSSSPSNAFGAVAELGVEYFVCKNFSLSAVADLGLYHVAGKRTYKDNDEDYSAKVSSSTKLVSGQLGGKLSLNFYF